MTGVYNRMEMERQVQEFFLTSEEKNAVFFMLDIDNFKSVNDRYGHGCGTMRIRTVADMLQTLFRKEVLICAMGGDEFAVFVQTKPASGAAGVSPGADARKLRFQVKDSEVTCSIGVCVAPGDGTCYQDLYRNADVALLMAKRLGKNRFTYLRRRGRALTRPGAAAQYGLAAG
jgi:diguanylate cyclase (GGDEF)-like protein